MLSENQAEEIFDEIVEFVIPHLESLTTRISALEQNQDG